MTGSPAFQRALPILLSDEGGFVNDPSDSGGATNLGVTFKAWSAWIGRPATEREIRALSPAVVAPFYLAEYWTACSCDALPAGLAYLIFDTAANEGPERARMFLQRVLGVVADGDIGPKTLLALRGCDPPTVIRGVCASREAHYRSLATVPRFGKGWLNRLGKVQARALFWATTPAPRTLADAAAGGEA